MYDNNEQGNNQPSSNPNPMEQVPSTPPAVSPIILENVKERKNRENNA